VDSGEWLVAGGDEARPHLPRRLRASAARGPLPQERKGIGGVRLVGVLSRFSGWPRSIRKDRRKTAGSSQVMANQTKSNQIKPLAAMGHSDAEIGLNRNDSVAWGSAVVSTAVFGVSPKTSPAPASSPIGDVGIIVRLAGEAPARATGTVALPNQSESIWPRGLYLF
jgi:hypothetical protein